MALGLWGGEEWSAASLFVALLAAIVVVFWAAISSLRSDGRVDFCYTQLNAVVVLKDVYIVKGHVPWRNDQTIGSASSPEEALELMRLVCPVSTHTGGQF